MNEFMVWDNIFKVFLNSDNIFIDSKGNMYNIEDRDIYELINNEHSLHKNIGLKDINGKSIYADSSIVENGIQKWKVIYNVFQMSYELECVSNKSLSNMRLTGAYQNQLKIIDTIQENKLGLIK